MASGTSAGAAVTGRDTPWMCLRCGYAMDAHDCFAHPGEAPSKGDLSLCMNCGARYVREADRWRPMTLAEFTELPGELRRRLFDLELARLAVIREDLAKGGGRA